MSIRVDEARFEELVDDALDSVPDALFEAMDNVVVLIADRNPDEPGLLGLYEGVALTERDTTYSGSCPTPSRSTGARYVTSARPRRSWSTRWR